MDGKNFDDLTRKLATGTSRRNVLRGLLGGAAALGGLKASGTLAARQEKTTICHATGSDSNPWVKVNVADPSLLPAHYSHGDFIIGDGCCRNQDCHCENQCETGVCTLTVVGAGEIGSGVCSCVAVADETPCNDGNLCTQIDTCQRGVCTGSNPVVCMASDQCHIAGTCDPATGLCSNPPKPDGSACDDGDLCTIGDTCQAGSCTAGAPVICAALDQCHVAGTCDPSTGTCSNPAAADGTACNDGNACTQTDACQNGVCVGSNPVVCTASDQCHVAGTCDPSTGLCSNPAATNGTACDDGNACTVGDTCQNGVCAPGPLDPCCGLAPCGSSCCAEGLICVDNECKIPCTVNSGCDSGCCHKTQDFCLPPTSNNCKG